MKFDFKAVFKIFILFFLNISPVLAQNTLNNNEIEKYIAVLPQIHQLDESFQAGTDAANRNQTMPSSPDTMSLTPITDNLSTLINHPTFDEFNAIIIGAGFSNSAEWASVGDKIMVAYSAYHLINPSNNNVPSIDDIKNNMQMELENIKKNQFISLEQKQALINKIQNSMALLNNPNYIDNENISIISPYIERLNSFLRNTNDAY